MPSSRLGRGLLALACLAALALALYAALPWIASTQIVRDRIAQEMSVWSGYRVRLGARPNIEVWPIFRAHLKDVTFHAWSAPDGPPVLQAETVHVDMSALSALSGRIVFSRIALERPVLRVAAGEDGVMPSPPLPGGGRIVNAIDRARAAVDSNPAEPSAANMPGDQFGVVEFVDGRVVRAGSSPEEDLVSSISGRLSWAALNRSASLTATAIWRGESVSLEATARNPLALLAGGNDQIRINLKSAPLSFQFEGLTSLSKVAFVDGAASISSPSMRRAMEWSRTSIGPGASVGAISLSGRVIGDTRRLKVENARISLGGNEGMGVFDIAFAEARPPAVAGTLAFESLDLRSFLTAFMPSPAADGRWHGEVDLGFTQQVSLDLRMSSARASVGNLGITEVAATAQVKDGFAAFDISDATAFGGTVQAGMRLERKKDANHGELRFLASDVDMAILSKVAGIERLAPQGRGNLSVILKGPVETWDRVFSQADGSISFTLGAGQIAGIDLAAFLKKSSEGGFFSLREVSSAALPIAGGEIKATVASGVARVDVARFVSGDREISIRGIVPYLGRGLALSGDVLAPEAPPGKSIQRLASFFVGGTWESPFISPVLSVPPIE